MELVKRKYARKEVEEIISDLSREYEERLSVQKTRIAELVKDNSELRIELDSYERKDKKISAALQRAENYASEIKQKTDAQYALATERISAFLEKWNVYFDHLKEKYPMYPVVQEAVKLRDKIGKIIGKKDAQTVIFTAEKEISSVKNVKKSVFDPKEKIADYIAATESGGFNMEEVLNPGALKLEDLCKELGLLTENDL